jgi:hypothetical protein
LFEIRHGAKIIHPANVFVLTTNAAELRSLQSIASSHITYV